MSDDGGARLQFQGFCLADSTQESLWLSSMACLIQIRKQSRTARPALEGPLICKGSLLIGGTSEQIGDGGGNFPYSVIRNPVDWLKLILLHSLRHRCGCVSCLWLVWYRHIFLYAQILAQSLAENMPACRFLMLSAADISCGDGLG